jgi:hypothetical protein
MRIRLSMVAVCVAVTGLAAEGALAGSAGRPAACKLLASALRKEGGVFLHHVRLDRGGNWTSCHYSDGEPPGPGSHWSLSFSFIPEPSAGAAVKLWQRIWSGWRGTTGEGLTVARLRGFGADNAFGYEKHDDDPAQTDTEIFWQKGRYYGQLEVRGPGMLGDFEDAEGLLKALMPGIPRS